MSPMEECRRGTRPQAAPGTDNSGRRIMLLTPEHVQAFVNSKAATPFAQRNFLNTVGVMFQWTHLEIPLHPKLRAIIDATPTVGVKTFLVTHFGKPYTAPGFGNWFRELCDAAGCHGVSAARLAQGDCSPARRDRMQRAPNRFHHRPCDIERGAAVHRRRRPQAHGARSNGEADRGRMVNKYLSNPGIRLDNGGAKALKKHENKSSMVGEVGVATSCNFNGLG
jgi:hypothetical protein